MYIYMYMYIMCSEHIDVFCYLILVIMFLFNSTTSSLVVPLNIGLMVMKLCNNEYFAIALVMYTLCS